MDFDFSVIVHHWRFLAEGVLVTLALSVVSGFTSIVAGLGVALLRLYGPRWLRPIVVLYPQASLVPKKVRLFVDFMARWFSERPGWDQATAPAPSDGKVVSLRKRAGRRAS